MGFFWQKYLILSKPSMCPYVRVSFIAPMELSSHAILLGLPSYYINVTNGHAVLSMTIQLPIEI